MSTHMMVNRSFPASALAESKGRTESPQSDIRHTASTASTAPDGCLIRPAGRLACNPAPKRVHDLEAGGAMRPELTDPMPWACRAPYRESAFATPWAGRARGRQAHEKVVLQDAGLPPHANVVSQRKPCNLVVRFAVGSAATRPVSVSPAV